MSTISNKNHIKYVVENKKRSVVMAVFNEILDKIHMYFQTDMTAVAAKDKPLICVDKHENAV